MRNLNVSRGMKPLSTFNQAIRDMAYPFLWNFLPKESKQIPQPHIKMGDGIFQCHKT